MNNIITSLFNRKSTRSFQDKPISDAEKDVLFESAIQAPTAGNQILYTILEIEEQSLKKELSIWCDNQPFIAEAPLVLIFLADCRRWLDCYHYAGAEYRKPGYGDMLLACSDALIAAQNTVVAAESLGIGSCYIGDILEHQEKIESLLHLDTYTLPIAMLVYGYPTEQQKKRIKPLRFNKKYIVQKNRYSRLPEQELRTMFAEVAKSANHNFDTEIQAFCNRKYMSDFAKEMTRSVSKYFENFNS